MDCESRGGSCSGTSGQGTLGFELEGATVFVEGSETATGAVNNCDLAVNVVESSSAFCCGSRIQSPLVLRNGGMDVALDFLLSNCRLRAHHCLDPCGN